MSKSSGVTAKPKTNSTPPVKAEVKKTLSKTTSNPVKLDSAKSEVPNNSKSETSSRGDRLSLSREGTHGSSIGGGHATTESSTSLVDRLVDAYSGESPSESSSTTQREGSNRAKLYASSESECPHSAGATRAKVQKLDEAGLQLEKARGSVEMVLERAVNARVYNKELVPEQEEKRAETEQERLTSAEGRLHRAKQKLGQEQEAHRQKKFDSHLRRRSAESFVNTKFEGMSQALKEHMLASFKPRIAKDLKARDDRNYLEQAMERHLRSDTQATRLAKDSGDEKLVERDKSPESVRRKKPKKERELKLRLDGDGFRETVRATSRSERSRVVESELRKLDGQVRSAEHREYESRMNQQLCEVQSNEIKTSQNEDRDRSDVTDSLLRTKAERTGKAGAALQPVDEAVDKLDQNSVRKVHHKLEYLDPEALTSTTDLDRALGRGTNEVRGELEEQFQRGGRARTLASKTLTRLDQLTRHTRLTSLADGWEALNRCIRPSGPTLGRFLGLPEGYRGGRASTPFVSHQSSSETSVPRPLLQRLASSATPVWRLLLC